MIIELPYFGKCDDQHLGQFLSSLQAEFQKAVELKKSYGLINNTLSKEEGISFETFSVYSAAAEHEYNVQMLQLRDRILNKIGNFTADRKA